jgi:choline dehydrogenase-like flavoprotein
MISHRRAGQQSCDPGWQEAAGADLPKACRILIVGGGMAGLEIAKELDLYGIDDVVVLEAGPAGDARHNNAVGSCETALRAWLDPESDPYFWQPWVAASPPHYTGPSGLRRRLGGRSLYWYGVCLPVEPWALRPPEWPARVVSDLQASWRGGAPLYQRVRDMLDGWRAGGQAADDDDGQPVATTLGGHQLRRTPLAVRRNEQGRWHAYSPLDAWRDPVTGQPGRQPRGVRVITGVEVLGVQVRDGRARGVSIRLTGTAETREIASDLVVLSAGTLENSRLGIQALAAVGALAERKLFGLSDHIVQGFFLRLSREQASKLEGLLMPGGSYAPCQEPTRSNIFVDFTPEPQGSALLDVRITGEQLPDEMNWVECRLSDEYPWPVSVHAAPSAADCQHIQRQREIIQHICDDVVRVAGAPSARLDFGDFDNPLRTNAFILPEIIGAADIGVPLPWSSYLGVEDHEGGTLPIGGTLSTEQEFAQVAGLFAAGPSTFPRMGAANPSLTNLALAHRLAGLLAESE